MSITWIRKLSRRVRSREALNPDVFVREGKSPADEDQLWSEHEEEERKEEADRELYGSASIGHTMALKKIDLLNNLEARVDELERIDHYRHRCEHCNGPAHKGGTDVS